MNELCRGGLLARMDGILSTNPATSKSCFSLAKIWSIKFCLLIIQYQPQIYFIYTPVDGRGWKWSSFIVSSPSGPCQFMSPGFTPFSLDWGCGPRDYPCNTRTLRLAAWSPILSNLLCTRFVLSQWRPFPVSDFRFSVYSCRSPDP